MRKMPVELTSTSTRAEALDRGVDERLRLLAGGHLAGVDRDALAARVERVARGLELGLRGCR